VGNEAEPIPQFVQEAKALLDEEAKGLLGEGEDFEEKALLRLTSREKSLFGLKAVLRATESD